MPGSGFRPGVRSWISRRSGRSCRSRLVRLFLALVRIFRAMSYQRPFRMTVHIAPSAEPLVIPNPVDAFGEHGQRPPVVGAEAPASCRRHAFGVAGAGGRCPCWRTGGNDPGGPSGSGGVRISPKRASGPRFRARRAEAPLRPGRRPEANAGEREGCSLDRIFTKPRTGAPVAAESQPPVAPKACLRHDGATAAGFVDGRSRRAGPSVRATAPGVRVGAGETSHAFGPLGSVGASAFRQITTEVLSSTRSRSPCQRRPSRRP